MRTPTRDGLFRFAVRAAALVGLATLVWVAFVLDLGRPYLWDPGEGRYAETVREMLITRNWLVPTLNFQPYHDKPPGFFWLVALAFQAFGPSEWAARLPAVVSAALTIALVTAFAWRRLGPAAGLGAGAVLATAIQFVVLGRSVRMDMLLTFTVTATLFYAYALWEAADAPREGRRPVTWPLYVLPAIGVLVKGPIAAVLPLLVLVAFVVWRGEPRRLRALAPGPGALVAVALASSWYVAAAVNAPDYLWVFLWHQNVGRFLGAGTGEGHIEPFWFFFWVLPVTFLPWTLVLPGAVTRTFRRARRGDPLETFLLVWFLVTFVFFTASRAKLATYLLPAFPALALMTATFVVRVLRAPAAVRARALRMPALVFIGGMLVVSLGTPLGVAWRYPGYGLTGALALMLVVFPLAGMLALRGARWRAVPVLILLAAVAMQTLFYRAGSGVVNEFSSLKAAAEMASHLPADAPVFAYKTRGHSFTFYGEHSLTRVRSPEAAAGALGQDAPAGLLTKAEYLERIQQHLKGPVCVWWQGPSGRVLLANVPPPASLHARVGTLRPSASTDVPEAGAPRC